MKCHTKIILLFSLLYSVIISGQEIKKHEWKQRILMVIVDSKEQATYKKQFLALKKDTKGLNERKLIVYHVTSSSYAVGLKNLIWKPSPILYKDYKKTKAPFEIILVGLDGGIKLRETSLLANEDLFSTIDAMPMRRNETKGN